jgi:hypothetical protein
MDMPEEKRPLKVFLCHAHSDRDKVRALYLRLKRDGVDAWLDKAKLLPGQDWELEIRKAVREADVVVVCLSMQFNQAGFRQKEVHLALDTAMEKPEGEIFIIPARLEECDNLESLRRWHWVDLFEDDGYEMIMRALRVRADKIGATLRIRKGGQADASHKKSKQPEKANEPSADGVIISEAVPDHVIVKVTQEIQSPDKNVKVNLEQSTVEEAAPVKSDFHVAEHPESENIDKNAQENLEGKGTEKVTQESQYITPRGIFEKPDTQKTKVQHKPKIAIIVAVLVLAGTVIVGLLGSPLIAKRFSSMPIPAETVTVTVSLLLPPISYTNTTRPLAKVNLM